MTFYRCIEKMHSKSFLPHFSTFVEILLKSCRKNTAGKLSYINFLMNRIQNVGLKRRYFLPTITTVYSIN